MLRQIRECSWELYMKNMPAVYRVTALYAGVYFLGRFCLYAAIPGTMIRALFLLAWSILTVPLFLWWENALLSMVKEETVPLRSCLTYYGNEHAFGKGALLILCRSGITFWFWGMGYGLYYGAAAGQTVLLPVVSRMLLLCAELAPFILELAVQPVYVLLVLNPKKRFSKMLAVSWKCMKGQRESLLRLYLSLICWYAVFWLIKLFLSLSGNAAWVLLAHVLWMLAALAIWPILAFCQIFFSLRVLEKK